MLQFTQSLFLQALGYAIVNSLWQFGLFWLLYLVINCLTSLSASKKYGAAVVLQVAGFCWFCITVVFYTKHLAQLPLPNATDGELWGGLHSPVSFYVQQQIALVLLMLEGYFPHLALAYTALLVVFMGKWVKCLLATTSIHRLEKIKCDVDTRLFVQKVCLQLGIKRPIIIWLSDSIKSPLTIGFLRPIILLPLSTISYLTPTQLEAVILHELAHIRRYDFVANLLLSVIEVILFFNPFTIIIARHIRRERENCCDDWVLQYQYDAGTYAHALLAIAKMQQQSVANKMIMNAVDQKQSLLIRVKRMIEQKDRTYNYRNRLFSLMFLSAVLSIVAWMMPANKRSSIVVEKTLRPPVSSLPDLNNMNPFFDLTHLLVNKNTIEIVKNDKRIAVTVADITSSPTSKSGPKIREGHKGARNFEQMVADSLLTGLPQQLQQFNRVLFKQGEINDSLNDVEAGINKTLENFSLTGDKVNKRFALTIKKGLTGAHNADINREHNKEIAKRQQEIITRQQLLTDRLLAARQKASDHYFGIEEQYDVRLPNEAIQLREVQFKKPLEWSEQSLTGDDNLTFFSYAPNVTNPHIFSYDYKERPIRQHSKVYVTNKEETSITIVIEINTDNSDTLKTNKTPAIPKKIKTARF